MKTTIKCVLSIVLAVAALLSLGACGRESAPKNRIYYEYFDTVSVIYDYTGGTQADFDKACELIEGELEACHKLFDIYNDYEGINNIKTVNDSAGEAVKVDGRIIELLTFAKEMYAETDGALNVAMGSVLSLWHELREEGKRIPTEAELAAAAEHTDIGALVIDSAASTVMLTDRDASLDVGAVAKGYTAERIAKMLDERGLDGYVLDLGGNLRVIGTKPNGKGWTSGIRNPVASKDTPYVRTLEIKNEALVTSAVDQRYYTVGGVNYHHIISPDTLMPAENFLSVSVRAPSSAVADALSTAIFNMTLSEAERFVESKVGIEVTLVLPDGTVRVLE